MNAKDWPEVESQVYQPARWLAFVLGALFLLTGIAGYLMTEGAAPPGVQQWVGRSMMAAVALVGALALAAAFGSYVPVHVRHAHADVLPDVPREPVICEGSVVYGRLTHELVRDADGWQFRAAERLLRNDLRFLVGFGVPFLALFAGIASWVAHNDLRVGDWPLAVVCGTVATVVCGGSVFFIAGMLMRAGYRRLCRLSIPLSGGDLELDSALTALMRVSKERKTALAGEALERLVHCPENTYRKTLLCECVSAYLPTDEEQRRQFEAMVRNHPDPGVKAMEMGLLDHVEQRGKLEGQRELVCKLLEARFGPLPPSIAARLQEWSSERLTEMGALLSATSLEELGLGAS